MKYYILLLYLHLGFILTNISANRKLYDEDMQNKVCNNRGSYKDINKTSLATYANELRFGQSNNSATNLTIELLTTGKVKGITDVLKNVIPWLVMLGIAAVIILCKIV